MKLSKVARLALGAVLLAVGCAKELNELTPFPCAADQQCPDGLACVPGTGCTPATVDAPCDSTTNCAAAGPEVSCENGLCSQVCQDGKGCPDGRLCSSAVGAAACAADCSQSASCPQGLECDPLWIGGERGCFAPSSGPTGCLGFDTKAQCNFCGPTNFTTLCSGGGSCPAHSTCGQMAADCTCNPGYAPVDCGGIACTGGCAFPGWWCAPVGQVQTACGDAPVEASGTCLCRDGRALALECGNSASCEERCSVGCDVIARDCANPALPKCTLTVQGSEFHEGCVALGSSAVAAGSACHRASNDLGGVGMDDCLPGEFCTGLGLANGTRYCQTLCESEATCMPTSRCRNITFGVPPVGACFVTCTPFDTSCGSGRTCTLDLLTSGEAAGFCRDVGAGTLTAPCTADLDCAANLMCLSLGANTSACLPLCDGLHPCPAGYQCHPQTGVAAGGGICLPPP